MRGPDTHQETLFSAVIPEERVPADHPLRPIREMVDKALERLDDDCAALYAEHGRPSNPPEKLLRAQLLMALYTIRSDRQLVEQIDYNLLFRWFVGFSIDDEVWNHSTLSKNRDRLLEALALHKSYRPKDESGHLAVKVADAIPRWIFGARNARGTRMNLGCLPNKLDTHLVVD